MLLFSDIVNSVLLPYLSFKFYRGEDLTQLVSKLFLFLLIIGCSLFLLFTTFKVEVLTLLYTPAYQKAAILVLPFSIVVIIRTVASLLGNILTISNRQISRVVTVGISLSMSLILNLICIPKFGILAGAWISVSVHIILFAMYMRYSRLELPQTRFFSKQGVLVLLAALGLYFLIDYTPGNYWVVLLAVFIWLGLVFTIMKTNGNYVFLSKILKERGTG